MNIGNEKTLGLVLAGGRATRFGGVAKGAMLLNDKPLVSYVTEPLKKFCQNVALNSIPELTHAYSGFDLDLVLDDPALADHGPLVGLLAGLEWAQANGAARLVIAPCDAPFLPANLSERLLAALEGPVEAAIATTAAGDHPLCSAWDTKLAEHLRAHLLAPSAKLAVKDFLSKRHAVRVMFPHEADFLNINTPEDLKTAQARLA